MAVTRRSADTTAQNVTVRQATVRSADTTNGLSARDKIRQAQEDRTAYQIQQFEQLAPTYYDGQGRIKPLGANNGYRARGIQANAPLGVGDRVSEQGGLVQATPRTGGNIDTRPINQRIDTLGKAVRSLIPTALQFDGDPNLATTPGTIDSPGRFDQDVAYDLESGTLFYWDDSVPEWVAFQQLLQGFSGDPGDQGGSAIPVYVDGAIAVNDAGSIYTGTVSGGWTELSTGGGGTFSGLQQAVLSSGFLADSTLHTIDWDYVFNGGQQDWDTDSFYDSANSTRFTIGTAGKYKIELELPLDINQGSGRWTSWQIFLRHFNSAGTKQDDYNGTLQVSAAESQIRSPQYFFGHWNISFAADDYIEVDVQPSDEDAGGLLRCGNDGQGAKIAITKLD